MLIGWRGFVGGNMAFRVGLAPLAGLLALCHLAGVRAYYLPGSFPNEYEVNSSLAGKTLRLG